MQCSTMLSVLNSTPYPTREFPQGDSPLHRLAWISRFHLNPMAMSEPAVDLIFTPYRWDVLNPDNVKKGSSYVYSKTRTARIGSGQLVGLHVGDFVEDRRVVAVPDYGPETYDLVMDVERMAVVRADATYQEGGEDIPYIPPRYYPLPDEALSTRCLVVEREVTDPREVSRFVFPCPVLLLTYFATSSGLLKEIVRGGLVYGTNRVFSPERTGFDADGTAHLGLRPRMDDDDARAIARFALVLERLEEAKYIYESMLLNADHGDGYVPVVLPPFRGPTRMVLHGKRILSGHHWHFLVFRIQDCTGAYPFECLRFVRDNDGRNNGTKDPNRPEAYKDTKTPPRHTSEKDKDEELEVRSDDEPSLERIETLVKLDGGQFSSTPEDVEKLDKDECNFRAAERTPNVNDGETTGLATADGDTGETVLDRLRLSRESREMVDLSDRLATFVQVLAEMRRQASPHLRYRMITLPPPTAGGGSGVSFFPDKSRGRTLSWSFLPGPPRKRRRVIIAEVSYCGYLFYLFEAEVRPPAGGDDEAVTALVVHTAGGAPLGERMLWRILLHGARRRGVWLNGWEWPELLREKLVHRAGPVERFAERFLEVFQEFASPPAETPALSPSGESDAGVPNAA
jgi:hypothetical protein